MKNNLLKTVAVIAIAVAMLATTVTSFAATASTVTTYNEGSEKLHVKSTVSGVDAGVMVTYLATKEGTVNQKDDIVYIGQETSTGADITFDYDALYATSAKILYGSDNSEVATGLNTTDTNREVRVAGVTVTGAPDGTIFTVYDSEKPAIETEFLGNNETGSIEIDLPAKYALSKVTVDDVDQDPTARAFAVKGGSTVAVEYVLVAGEVDLDGAKEYFVNEEAEDDSVLYTKGLVCKINGLKSGANYGIYAEKDGQPFELDSTLEITNGFYSAGWSGDAYYAVQLATHVQGALEGVNLYPAYAIGNVITVCR